MKFILVTSLYFTDVRNSFFSGRDCGENFVNVGPLLSINSRVKCWVKLNQTLWGEFSEAFDFYNIIEIFGQIQLISAMKAMTYTIRVT